MPATIFDDLPIPPVGRLLGWKLLSLDSLAGSIAVEFLAINDFTNPSGFIQGGLLAAMLDDTMGPAVFAMTDGKSLTTTIGMQIHCLRPVRPGRVTTTGKVTKLGARIAFLEGELFDHQGKLAATAAASAVLTDYRPA
jgi:uncharacterized protein (TIGR00369 family)